MDWTTPLYRLSQIYKILVSLINLGGTGSWDIHNLASQHGLCSSSCQRAPEMYNISIIFRALKPYGVLSIKKISQDVKTRIKSAFRGIQQWMTYTCGKWTGFITLIKITPTLKSWFYKSLWCFNPVRMENYATWRNDSKGKEV